MKYLPAIAAFLALTAPLSMAKDKEEKKKATPEEAFKKRDTNGDGKLSVEEFTGKHDADKAKTAFGKLDKDSDGFLTLEESSAKVEGGKKKKKE